jgi:hypothetical protein
MAAIAPEAALKRFYEIRIFQCVGAERLLDKVAARSHLIPSANEGPR